MPYTRALSYRFPLIRGEDVLAVQVRLRELGYAMVGQFDGMFGGRTEAAVRAFQQSRGLKVDGIVGPLTWSALFEATPSKTAFEKVNAVLAELKQPHSHRDSVVLKQPHSHRDSVVWYLSLRGIIINDGEPETFGGAPETVRRVWQSFSTPIEEWASKFGVPVELIVATICTETRGDPSAIREEPDYISDAQTPDKVSPGLMQTLISTARDTLGDDTIGRAWLLEPGNSIRAGTAYITRQWKTTHFDPPKVACAYNAGGIYHNASSTNRWKMKQYPMNSSEHADRFIKWFNECFELFDQDHLTPTISFFRLLRT
jgi:hypothetical protein